MTMDYPVRVTFIEPPPVIKLAAIGLGKRRRDIDGSRDIVRYRHGWIPLTVIDRTTPPSGRWQRGQWRELTPSQERATHETNVREFVNGDDMATWRAERTEAQIEQAIQAQVDMLTGPERGQRIYRNGPHQIVVDNDMDDLVPVAEVAEVLDDLIERHPAPDAQLRSRSVRYRRADASDDRTTSFGGTAKRAAHTAIGAQGIIINSHAFAGNPAGDDMPTAHHVATHIFVLAHEYGHTVYPHDADDTQSIWDAAREAAVLDPTGTAMSEYGSFGGPHEMFAEAFAEWFLSEGRTGNVWARVFARRFGWR